MLFNIDLILDLLHNRLSIKRTLTYLNNFIEILLTLLIKFEYSLNKILIDFLRKLL